MPGKVDLTRGWILKGDSDCGTAERIVQGPGPYDTACFHTQQAVEKYLKSLLAFLNQPIPPIHDLVVLYDKCAKALPGFSLSRQDLANLTPFAVQLRYDVDFWPDADKVLQALQVVRQVRKAVLAVLPLEAQP